VHAELAAKLGVGELVDRCAKALGNDYEAAVKSLLGIEQRWTTTVIDDGKRQNVPDLLLSLGSRSALIECKTTTKNPPLIKKEEAFAVLQKAVDFDKSIHRVTLGKPGFDEHSKKKVQAAKDISLVEHDMFVEAMLRVVAGKISPTEFFNWMTAPGVAELDRLGGPATYEILREP
jgi:helicase